MLGAPGVGVTEPIVAIGEYDTEAEPAPALLLEDPGKVARDNVVEPEAIGGPDVVVVAPGVLVTVVRLSPPVPVADVEVDVVLTTSKAGALSAKSTPGIGVVPWKSRYIVHSAVVFA